jgi:Na+-driven multidrug efflux pump
MDGSQRTSWLTILIRLLACAMISVGIALVLAGVFFAGGRGTMFLAGVLVIGFAASLLAVNPRKSARLPAPPAISPPESPLNQCVPPEYHRGANDADTPLVLTFLNDIGLPILCAVAAMYGLTLSGTLSFLTSLCIAPLFIWVVVRMMNRRSDPRRIKTSMQIPNGDDSPESE